MLVYSQSEKALNELRLVGGVPGHDGSLPQKLFARQDLV